jgi:hypothetical protein
MASTFDLLKTFQDASFGDSPSERLLPTRPTTTRVHLPNEVYNDVFRFMSFDDTSRLKHVSAKWHNMLEAWSGELAQPMCHACGEQKAIKGYAPNGFRYCAQHNYLEGIAANISPTSHDFFRELRRRLGKTPFQHFYWNSGRKSHDAEKVFVALFLSLYGGCMTCLRGWGNHHGTAWRVDAQHGAYWMHRSRKAERKRSTGSLTIVNRIHRK